jgi:hypothetical protein
LAALAVGITLAIPAAASAESATVTVSARVRPSIRTSVEGDALIVRANTAWTVTLRSAGGLDRSVSGGVTGAHAARIPLEGSETYTVLAEGLYAPR